MFSFIARNKALLNAARQSDYVRFAAIYNGAKPGSEQNTKYALALQNAHQKSTRRRVGDESASV